VSFFSPPRRVPEICFFFSSPSDFSSVPALDFFDSPWTQVLSRLPLLESPHLALYATCMPDPFWFKVRTLFSMRLPGVHDPGSSFLDGQNFFHSFLSAFLPNWRPRLLRRVFSPLCYQSLEPHDFAPPVQCQSGKFLPPDSGLFTFHTTHCTFKLRCLRGGFVQRTLRCFRRCFFVPSNGQRRWLSSLWKTPITLLIAECPLLFPLYHLDKVFSSFLKSIDHLSDSLACFLELLSAYPSPAFLDNFRCFGE